MFKKIRTLRIVNICFFVSFLGFFVVCSNFEKPQNSDWVQSLFLLGSLSSNETDEKKNDSSSPEVQSDYEIHTVTPNILIENEDFEIIGKNLMKLLDSDLLGGNANKYISYLETSDTKLVGHVKVCPSVPFEIVMGNSNIGFQKRNLPCLKNFYYSRRSYVLDLNQSVTNIGPAPSDPSLEILRNLGEIQFEITQNIPEGMTFDPKTGNLSGIPIQTTNNEFQKYNVIAKLKANPKITSKASFSLIVLTNEEKTNRTCRSISVTSTCNGPSPHTCSNASRCFNSQFACISDQYCGF